jgi:hypothetical protein
MEYFLSASVSEYFDFSTTKSNAIEISSVNFPSTWKYGWF